jgi:hypothetical protein
LIHWQPQPGPQSLAIAAHFIDELMYGGARGGGKSDYLLGDFLQDIEQGEKWRGILFRKSYPELEELILRAKEIFAAYGAVYKVADKTFFFPGGASLKMRHIDTEVDADKYQGHQYTWIGFDELTNWPNLNAYKKLKACLRSALGVKNKRIRCSANPGGVGHHVVKHYYIDPAPKGKELIQNVDEDGTVTTKMFIPSKVSDNKILLRNDPTYVARLREIGSAELVKAWLDGDWNVITGAYFPEFSSDKHVVEPFEIPRHWMRFRSADWGSASPFAILWHAVSDGYQVPGGIFIPQGALVTYREWYGTNGKPNEGLRMTGGQVAKGIKTREATDNITYGVIDPSAYKEDGGPSIAERMSQERVYFRKADNQRIPGWDQVRDRLCGVDDRPMIGHNGGPELDDERPDFIGVGTPMWYCFKTCVHLIRTLPALQHDINNPEDADSDGEDHAPDALRYGFMSRPWTRPKPPVPNAPLKTLQDITMNDMWELQAQAENGFIQV